MTDSADRVLIIAEVGVNHNGDMALAKKIVDAIATTDVDVIKFQTAVPELLMSVSTPKAEYQKASTGEAQSAIEMIAELQFTADQFIELKAYVESVGKVFLSTAFDHLSLAFLSDIGLRLFKIPSGEITNLPYLRDVARRADDIILSTGMSQLSEVDAALSAIVSEGFPRERITVLQCNTAYPSPISDTNLRAMVNMGRTLEVMYGYSDHTEGISASVAAVALGARVIEKHVTTDRNLPGPDQHASMEPADFALLVSTIREIEQALGSPDKRVSESERINIPIARRGLYAARDIAAGSVISEDDLVALRPEAEVSPMAFDVVVGATTSRSFDRHEAISLSGLVVANDASSA
jgi:N,N'-diacetyllegionaminate synthase